MIQKLEILQEQRQKLEFIQQMFTPKTIIIQTNAKNQDWNMYGQEAHENITIAVAPKNYSI